MTIRKAQQQPKKKPATSAKLATQKVPNERQLETERRLAEDRRALEDHARKLDESIQQASDLATSRLAERLKPLKDKLRALLSPARSMDLALQRLEDARAGLDVPADAPPLLEVLIEAEPHGTYFDPDTKWPVDADLAQVERAALDLFSNLHQQCEALDAAVKKAEGEAQTGFLKLVKPTRECITTCLDVAKRLAQWSRNRTALSNGRPLPFTGVGTADELHTAAKKALATPVDLTSKVRTAIDNIDIPLPTQSDVDIDDVISDDATAESAPAA